MVTTVFFVYGAIIQPAENGDLIVTTTQTAPDGKTTSTTTTRVSPGDSDWSYWNRAIVAYLNSMEVADYWNQRNAPKGTSGTSTPNPPPGPGTGGSGETTLEPLGGNGGAGGAPPNRGGAAGFEDDDCGCGDGGVETYQTYTVTNDITGEVYSGRTRGTGTPEENIRRRFNAGHDRTGNGWGDPVLDKSSFSRAAIRGREQMLIDYFRSQGIAADQINGISPRNPNYATYMDAARKEFGSIDSDPRYC